MSAVPTDKLEAASMRPPPPSLWQRSARLRFFLMFSLIAVVVWALACRMTGVRPFIFPAPADVFNELVQDPLWLLYHSMFTVGAALAAFTTSVVLGLFFAVCIVYSRLLDRTLFTTLVATNAVPKVAIAPLFILWIGTGLESKVLIAVLVSLFPMVVDAVVGLRSVDPGQLDLARTYRGSNLQMFWKIRFPNALPSIFAGMKVAISLALVGTIVGEFVGSNEGLGFIILQSQGQYNTPRVFASILLLSVLGIIMFQIVDLIERHVMPWHVSHRAMAEEA